MAQRDTQQQRVYDAEMAVPGAVGSNMLFTDVQPFIDALMDKRVIRARWGLRKITAVRTHGYRGRIEDRSTIRLGADARNRVYVLHEVAHCLTPWDVAAHGPEFCGVLLFLLRAAGLDDEATALRAAYRTHKVRVNTKGIPALRAAVPPPAAERERVARAAGRAPLTIHERRTLVRLLHRATLSGEFGTASADPRKHADAALRHMKKGLTD